MEERVVGRLARCGGRFHCAAFATDELVVLQVFRHIASVSIICCGRAFEVNRLHKLERIEPHNLPLGAWPGIMGVDEWEVLASGMQDALVSASRGDRPRRVTHTERQGRKADDGLGVQRAPSALDQYLAARRSSREALHAATELSALKLDP